MTPTASASWRIQRSGARTIVEIEGRLDENADLAPLKAELAGEVELRLGGVVRVNSTGVRAWVELVHDLPSVTRLFYSHCSPAIVTQLNTIYNFRGPAKVESIMAPYVCEACSSEALMLIDLAGHAAGAPPTVPAFRCHQCGGEMAFDDLPERYLSFLRET